VIQIGEAEDFVAVKTPQAKIKRPAFNWLCVAQLNFAARMKAFAMRRADAAKRRKHTGFVQ